MSRPVINTSPGGLASVAGVAVSSMVGGARVVRALIGSFCVSLLAPLLQSAHSDSGGSSFAWLSAHAQEITIGVPELSRTLNFLIPSAHQPTALEHLAASLIRDAVTRTLISLPNSKPVPVSRLGAADLDRVLSGGGASFSLELSDSVQVSPDQREWRLRIRRDQVFSSGKPVRSEDVVYSLERCTKSVRGRAGRQSGFSLQALDHLSDGSIGGPGGESWVAVRDNGQGAFSLRLTELLSSCPIIERQSGELFGDQLGMGSNVVGTGRFKIQSVDGGREYHLQQVRFGTTKSKKVVIRALKDGTHALTALRSGTVDAIFFDSEDVLSKAGADQTLLISECSGYKFVHRRALRVECRGQITARVPTPLNSGVQDSEERGGVPGGSVLVGGGLFGRPPVFGPSPIDLVSVHYVS